MRSLAGAAATQLGGAVAGPVVLFVEMMLTLPLRLNSSAVSINWNGSDWIGAGALGGVDDVSEQAGEMRALRFTLSGVPSDLLTVALAEPIRNKDCTVYVCVLDANTHAVLDVPSVWTGKLDQMPIRHGSETCVISVTAEHAGATYGRPKPLRYTDADQQRLYPGDTSLRFVVDQSQKQDAWPAASYFKR